MYFGLPVLFSLISTVGSNCIDIPLDFRTIAALNGSLVIPSHSRSSFLFNTSDRVLRNQPPSHNCVHLAIIFNVQPQKTASALKTDDNRSIMSFLDITIRVDYLVPNLCAM
jgi:hypothetical protein